MLSPKKEQGTLVLSIMEKSEEKEIQTVIEHHVLVDKDGENGKDVIEKEEVEEKPMELKKGKRVAALDAFRGLTIVVSYNYNRMFLSTVHLSHLVSLFL